MSNLLCTRWGLTAIVAAWIATAGAHAQTQDVQPVNSGANPYHVIRDWAQLTPERRPWGGSNGVAIDRDGKSVWATDRCSPGIAPGCLGTKANPIHHFDEIGEGDQELWRRHVRVAAWHPCRSRRKRLGDRRARGRAPDELKKFPGENKKGSVVVKFSPEGKVLMTLGKPGVQGNPPDALTDPNDVVTDPGNGDIYVAESHTERRGSRISSGASRCSTGLASSCGPSARPEPARANSARRTRSCSIRRAG